MTDAILVINAGSSSIKFALFAHDGGEKTSPLCSGEVDGIGDQAQFRLSPIKEGGQHTEHVVVADSHGQALHIILDWLETELPALRFVAAGHRVVHGGAVFTRAVRVDERVLEQLKSFIPLAPLHQPHALHAMEALLEQRPQLPQVACFDTAFHAGMPLKEQRFALPRALLQEGIRRYGFHGLSYEYICGVLPKYLDEAANGKVVIAHLGHGVSLCAVEHKRSVATTMSFTPLDGLPMGTRSGAIDPAIVLYLLQGGMTANDVSQLLHHQSGLLGLSGISSDMRTLLHSDDPAAAEAVEFFCYRVSRELGSLAAALGGLDAVVFTGGIGEHAAAVRANICQASTWLGLELDNAANQANAPCISSAGSKVSAWVIPTNEQQVIARHTATLLTKVVD
jgi:acetate kinase